MSYISGLNISLVDKQMEPLSIIEELLKLGWTYNDNNQVTYLPIGDAGMYNWQSVPLNEWKRIKEIIAKKIKLNETVGLVLTWENTQIGGDFHFMPLKDSLSITWSVNRKKLKGGYTDHSWYIPKVLNPIRSRGFNIEVFECNDMP